MPICRASLYSVESKMSSGMPAGELVPQATRHELAGFPDCFATPWFCLFFRHKPLAIVVGFVIRFALENFPERNFVTMHEGYIHEPEEENPELALRHFGRALEFLRAGDGDRAIEELKQVLEHEPDFSEARKKLEELTEARGKISQ